MFSSNLKSTAKRLLKDYGNSIILEEVIEGVRDSNIGLSNDTTIDHPMKANLSFYATSDEPLDITNINDMLVLIETDLVPSKKWNVKYNNQIWNIINIRITTAQDMNIVYELQVRSK